MSIYEELKLEIFESAECGEITESEKDSLLETLDSVYESTAYNRKYEELENKLENKMDEYDKKEKVLKKLLDESDNDKEKARIQKKFDEIRRKKRDAQKNLNELLKKISPDGIVTSLKCGRAASRYLKDAENGKVPHKSIKDPNYYENNAKEYMSYGKDAKEHAVKNFNAEPAKEKKAGKYLKAQQALRESVIEMYLDDMITESEVSDFLDKLN